MYINNKQQHTALKPGAAVFNAESLNKRYVIRTPASSMQPALEKFDKKHLINVKNQDVFTTRSYRNSSVLLKDISNTEVGWLVDGRCEH